MLKPILIDSAEHMQRFCALAGVGSLTPEILARHQADASWMLLDGGDHVRARCSLWWRRVPEHPSRRLGLIGHFAAQAPDTAAQLLSLVCDQLSRHGCTLAVGPLDGNTWRQYRLITERGNEPSFFLEPDHPDDWPAYFSSSGFCSLARYVSMLNPDPCHSDIRLRGAAKRLRPQGIYMWPLNLERFEDQLRQIYPVVIESCRNNFLFTPISECEFMLQYLPLRPYIRPEMVLLAERRGTVIGFCFAIPNVLQSQRGCSIDTAIIKTLCVLPEYAGKGLGSLLVSQCQEIAAALGYRRVIHALMLENNISRRISSHFARPIRRYTLFAKDLLDTKP